MIETVKAQTFTCDLCKKKYPYSENNPYCNCKLKIDCAEIPPLDFQVCGDCASTFYLAADLIRGGKIERESLSNFILRGIGVITDNDIK